MKKLHFSLMAILFALFSKMNLKACSSDDDDAPSQDDIKTNCIGMWQTTHISGWDYDEDDNLIKVDQDVPIEDSDRILFKGDGTYKWYLYYAGEWHSTSSTPYKYEVAGNKIILYDHRGDVDITYTVVSYKNDTVVLEVTLEEGPQYKQRITCKRVN